MAAPALTLLLVAVLPRQPVKIACMDVVVPAEPMVAVSSKPRGNLVMHHMANVDGPGRPPNWDV